MTDGAEPSAVRAPSLHRATIFAVLVCAALTLTSYTHVFPFANARWPGALFLLLTCAATLLALCRDLPAQNVLSAAAIIVVISSLAEILNAKTSLPFGTRVYGADLGPQFLGVPWPVPLLWLTAILNSRGVARLILRPHRRTATYGLWVIGLACVLTVIFDLGLEPWAATANNWWLWLMPPSMPAWQHTPWVNFLGRAVTTLLTLAFVTPWLLNKKTSAPAPPDFQPLVLWLLLIVLPAAGNGTHQLLPAAVAAAIFAVIISFLALRNARS
jgi:uncharacterized membrane protein